MLMLMLMLMIMIMPTFDLRRHVSAFVAMNPQQLLGILACIFARETVDVLHEGRGAPVLLLNGFLHQCSGLRVCMVECICAYILTAALC